MKKFRHKFKGFKIHPSACNVYIHSNDDNHYILFEDIDEGTSVTNASEQLATEIISLLKLDPDDCHFFETYSQYEDSTIDGISYKWLNKEAFNIALNKKKKQLNMMVSGRAALQILHPKECLMLKLSEMNQDFTQLMKF